MGRRLLSIPVPRTPDGRVYRYSPNVDAHPRHFVLGETVLGFAADPDRAARTKYTAGTPGTVCPYSGIRADDSEFTHPDDRKAAVKIVKQAALQDMQDAVSEMLAGVARGSKSITYKPAPRQSKPRPRFGRRDLMRLLVCDCCGRDCHRPCRPSARRGHGRSRRRRSASSSAGAAPAVDPRRPRSPGRKAAGRHC